MFKMIEYCIVRLNVMIVNAQITKNGLLLNFETKTKRKKTDRHIDRHIGIT